MYSEVIRSGITSDIFFYASRPDVTLQGIEPPGNLVETVTFGASSHSNASRSHPCFQTLLEKYE